MGDDRLERPRSDRGSRPPQPLQPPERKPHVEHAKGPSPFFTAKGELVQEKKSTAKSRGAKAAIGDMSEIMGNATEVHTIPADISFRPELGVMGSGVTEQYTVVTPPKGSPMVDLMENGPHVDVQTLLDLKEADRKKKLTETQTPRPVAPPRREDVLTLESRDEALANLHRPETHQPTTGQTSRTPDSGPVASAQAAKVDSRPRSQPRINREKTSEEINREKRVALLTKFPSLKDVGMWGAINFNSENPATKKYIEQLKALADDGSARKEDVMAVLAKIHEALNPGPIRRLYESLKEKLIPKPRQ